MRILLTAFNAFGDLPENPSQVLIERYATLRGLSLAGGLFTRVLDTSYRSAELQIVELLEILHPDVLLMFGVAQGSQRLRIERRAINRDHAGIPDNSGELRIDHQIDPYGAPEFSSTFPAEQLLQVLRTACIPADLSDDAGTFVCNHTLYSALRHIITFELPTKCGFIHIPLPADMSPGKRSESLLTFDDMVRAVDICVGFLGTHGIVA